MKKFDDKGAIKLCARSCCPTVSFLCKEEIILTDDFGGEVTLNEENVEFLIDEFNKMKEERDKGA